MWSGANIWIITTVCGTSSTVSMLFAIKGFVSKKCRKATHKSKKLVKKEDLDIDRTPNNSLYFHLANAACTAAAASHGYNAETVSFSFTLLNNAHVDDRLTANAREMLQLQSIRVFDFKITDQKGTLICNGTFTMNQTCVAI